MNLASNALGIGIHFWKRSTIIITSLTPALIHIVLRYGLICLFQVLQKGLGLRKNIPILGQGSRLFGSASASVGRPAILVWTLACTAQRSSAFAICAK